MLLTNYHMILINVTSQWTTLIKHSKRTCYDENEKDVNDIFITYGQVIVGRVKEEKTNFM